MPVLETFTVAASIEYKDGQGVAVFQFAKSTPWPGCRMHGGGFAPGASAFIEHTLPIAYVINRRAEESLIFWSRFSTWSGSWLYSYRILSVERAACFGA